MAFSLSHGDYEVRKTKHAWREERLTSFRKICLRSDEEPKNEQVYTMYHGTTLEAAQLIISHGFKPSNSGMLGKGVYVSRDDDKAASYPVKEKERLRQVILELRVNVGKVKKIDELGHPLQTSWHDHGYDTAWVPPGCGMVDSDREEDCVWDPNRIQVIDAINAPKNSLRHLQNLIKVHDPGFHKMALKTKKRKKKQNIHIMYHATTVTAAEQVITQGFKPSPGGILGKGVYITRYENKATRELLNNEHVTAYQVMLRLRVNVGNVLEIDTKSHSLKETWYKMYDTVWVSPASGIVNGVLGDFCVRDRNRIKVIGIEEAPERSLCHLQSLIKYNVSGRLKRRRNKRGKKNWNVYI